MAFPVRSGPSEVATGAATLFTATKDQRITGLYLGDRSGASRTVTVHIVGATGSAANSNKLYDSLPVPQNDWVVFYPLSIPLKIGDTIQGVADASGVMFVAEISDEKGTTWR